ncbi:MAG: response regulator [Pseudomonadota bacterium]
MSRPVLVPILLVDDNDDNLVALSALLEGLEGLDLVAVRSGEDALRQLLRRDFGLVLMDVQMPGMDGYETATLMRANPKTRQVPIIFVTALLAGADFAFRGYESGAVDYLVKPLESVMLHAKVNVFATLYRQRQAIADFERYVSEVESVLAARRAHPDSGQLRLLLVDDRPANLLALEGLLADLKDVQLVRANSGPDALRAVLRADYAAILLDVQMPGMDGFETAELIRANPKTSMLPIIFVTAGMKQREAQFKGYELGAVDYLIKPLEPAILVSKVRVFCDLYRQRMALQQQSSHLETLVAERTEALRQSADELSDSRERYRRLLGAVTHQLFSLRRTGQQLRSYGHGSGCEAVTGYPPQAFEADPVLWLTIVPEAERAALSARAAGTLDSGQIGQMEHRIRCCDGVLRWVRTTFVRAGTDLEPSCDVLIEDIDQRRRSEEERARLVDQLALATRAAHLGIWDWNLASNELLWDEPMYRMCGVAPGQLGDAHQTWLATVYPDDRLLCERAMHDALRHELPYDIEFRVRWPDGTVRHMKAEGQVVRNPQGQPVRIIGIHTDITERKRAEEEMRRHRDHLLELVDERTASLGAIVDHAADGIVTVDEAGLILSFNRAAERMFGYSEADTVGRSVSMLIPEMYRARQDNYLARRRDAGEERIVGRGVELPGLRRDGVEFPLSLAISEMDVGGRRRYTGIVRDISQQKAAEASLIAARKAAETANQVKSEFLAKMSHELRTPLNAVIGFSHLMAKSDNLSSDQQRNLEIIHRSGQHLLTLINDVLALSKIEAGGTQLEAADTDLADLLGEVVEMLRIRAQHAGLEMQLVLNDVPPAVRVDAVKLRQVLINLLSNALKFTLRGQVRLEASAQPHDACSVRIGFVIGDTGIGMAPGDLQRIFDPFVQVRNHASEGGTGLGLAISRQYVELLGGKLQVESELGSGSTFRFTLTLPLADAPQRMAAAGAVIGLPAQLRGKRVLIVDDDAESRILLGELLEPLGFVVAFAGDGQEALARAAAFSPHLVMMDWRMPQLDGLSAIRRLRDQPDGEQLRIIMCTASAFEEQRATALEAGANAFLRKPLNEAELYATIEAQLGLCFLRADALAGTPAPCSAAPVLRAELDALPAPVRKALREGAVELDQRRLDLALAEIARDSPDLAARLRHMTDAFRYRELWGLLDG